MTNKKKLREIIRERLAYKNKYHTSTLDKLTDDIVDILIKDDRITVSVNEGIKNVPMLPFGFSFLND